MARPLKGILGVVALLILLVAGLYAYRSLMLWDGRTPEGYQLLTAIPGAESFEPKTLPSGPVLDNQSTTGLTVHFGYKVGGIPFSYALDLAFPPKSGQGQAKLTALHANRVGTVETATTRLWDAPRKAYAVALEDKFVLDPPVPSLCIKAVIGPNNAGYDLEHASLCIAQRDARGTCHPETLACGLIRQGS